MSTRDMTRDRLNYWYNMLRKRRNSKIQKLFIRLALMLNENNVKGSLRNLDNGKVPHATVRVGDDVYSAVYFASKHEWKVFNGYGRKSTKCWVFKEYPQVARFLQGGCQDDSEAVNVNRIW